MLKRTFTRSCFFCFLYLLFVTTALFGQQELNFTSLTTKNGLSANTVNVILQDHNGLIWFGTSDGLNKFDGTNFTVYLHDAKDSTSLPANEIVALHEDHTGKLWVGTTGGGMAYYDQRSNSFITYKGDPTVVKNQPVTARAFFEDSNGNLWVGSYGGFRIIENNLKKVSYVDITRVIPNTVNTLVVLSFFEDSAHRIWLGTNAGVLLYNRQLNQFTRYTHSDVDSSSLGGDEVRAIAQDVNGRLFFGTNRGLSMLLPGEKSFRVFKHSDSQPQSISSDLIYSIVTAPNAKLWIGTEEGLDIFDCNTFLSSVIKPDRRKSFSLTNKSVRSVYFAKKGIVWLGTYQGGVNKYDPNLALFNVKHSTPFDPQGLASPVVTAFAEYKPGGIFVATDGGGLHYFDRVSGLFKHYGMISKVNHSAAPFPILAMELGADKKLWIGTYQNGVFNFDPATGKYKQFLADGTDRGLSQNDIFFIKQDSRGLIWIGTNGHGVDVFDPRTQVFKNYSNHPAKNGQLMPLNGFMRAMAEDRSGSIWLGSAGSGVAVYNPLTNQFSVYNKLNSNLSNDGVLSILHDRAGNTWVGTNSGGINLFHPESKTFTHLSESDGLANGVIDKIIEDNEGIIWVSTDKGISSIDPKTKKIKNFGRPNGVQDSPFVEGAGMLATNGELYFGGQDGFNYFTPSVLPVNTEIPPVLLTDLKVANNIVIPGENSPIAEQISMAKDIYLDYGQNFSISYVALNYTAPHQNQYAYKLSGFDKDWNNVGKEKTAYYTNLDPGQYTFQVRASNNDGIWDSKITSVTIHVRPPLWRTVYAYLFYVLTFAGILYFIRHRGIQKIKNQIALEQEKINARKLVEQQRREAEYIHELDMQKIKFLTNLSHEFRTPISLMLAPADKLLATQKDPAVSSQLKMIRRNARRLLNLVNQLLDFRKMEEQELILNLTEGDLIGFIKDAAESFHDLSDRKKITLSIGSTAPYLPAKFDHDKIERIIFNLLSNAFKFTNEGGQIQVKMSVAHHDADKPLTLFITVADTGIGIDPEVQPRIFDRFFMEKKASSILNQGSGIGLSITREFVQLHGGEITVESQQGKGTIFKINLPVVGAAMPFADDLGDRDDLTEEMNTVEPIIADKNTANVTANKPTILLVEDNDEFRYHLRNSLQHYYQIIEAKDGKEGWQKALAGHPQLIVSDIGMPYINGIELSQKIKADKRTNHIPIILLTASNAEEDQLKGLESGANDYLTKPFNFDILNTKIKNLMLYNRSLKDVYSKQIQVTGKEIEIESTDAKLLNTIVQHIDAKLNDSELSVEELSRHVGMSRGSLYHKLLELTGLTPIEYIRSVKLERAATLLEKSDYNVAQIAYMTGFGTPSYFSRLFKTRYGCLPSEYITNNRKDTRTRMESSLH